MGDNGVKLPPGFRFYPTDEELIVHFLHRKASLLPCHPDVIPDLHLHPLDPWNLNEKALKEGKRWYFYSRRNRNRVTKNGYWKPLEVEEAVFSSGEDGEKVGVKKHFIFYVGEHKSQNSGVKTNWVMHEYRLSDGHSPSTSRPSSSSSSKRRGHSKTDYGKWVICRVFERDEERKEEDGTELSCLDEVFLSFDDLDEISPP